MKTELEKLFITITEEQRIKPTDKYRKFNKKLNTIHDKLDDEKLRELFDDLYEVHMGLKVEDNLSHFIFGFKMGMAMAMEAMLF